MNELLDTLNKLNISTYYGIDWLAMLLTLIAIYYIGNKAKSGFSLMIAGNICWIVLGFLSSSIAMVIANILFAGMNVRAISKWTQEDADE